MGQLILPCPISSASGLLVLTALEAWQLDTAGPQAQVRTAAGGGTGRGLQRSTAHARMQGGPLPAPPCLRPSVREQQLNDRRLASAAKSQSAQLHGCQVLPGVSWHEAGALQGKGVKHTHTHTHIRTCTNRQHSGG